MKKFLQILVIAVLLLQPVLLIPAQTASAQCQNTGEWAAVLNCDGTLRSDLVLVGEVQVALNTGVPGYPAIAGLTFPNNATFTKYVTASGQTVMIPGPLTVMMMSAYPESFPPGLLGYTSSYFGAGGAGGTAAGTLIATLLGKTGLTPEKIAETIGKINAMGEQEFIRGLLTNTLPENSVGLGTTYFFEMLRLVMSGQVNLFHFGNGLLLYNEGCAETPGGCPPAAAPLPPFCSVPTTTPGNITITTMKVDPAYPLVVGQDDMKRGVDVKFTITIEPTIYHYEEEIVVEDRELYCRYDAKGGHGGCPKGDGEYDAIDGPGDKGDSYHYEEGPVVVKKRTCIPHDIEVPEGLNWVLPSLKLAESSKAWITGTLAQVYPGATVKQPDWTFPWGGPEYGSYNGNTFVYEFVASRVQLVDPGFYKMLIEGSTSGAMFMGVIPVSDPRPIFKDSDAFPVYLIETEIVR